MTQEEFDRKVLLAKLVKLLMLLQVRRYFMYGETAAWMGPLLPRAPWVLK